MKKQLLIIGHTFPEATTTAAGVRMIQLIAIFRQQGYAITFASAADRTQYSVAIEAMQVEQIAITLNDSSFDQFVSALQPQVVIYDRFTSEEQYGWRVAENCPKAIKILDTEDLHFLRKAREESFKKEKEINLFSNTAKREMASILRCDLNLIISSAEMKLLIKTFFVPKDLLLYFPLFAKADTDLIPFEEREHFISIGNFKHTPNLDAVLWLHEEIWPNIKAQLPNAQLQVYGAYAPQQILELHNEKLDFLIKGWTPSVVAVMQSAKVCLAPLQFGAGLKGKLIDAARVGTPAVTTTIGNEGLYNMHKEVSTAQELVTQAIGLYTEKSYWEEVQRKAVTILNKYFDEEQFIPLLTKQIDYLLQHIEVHRKEHFIGQILQHQSLNATKYMSKWIEEKNKH